jgi:hypothetical protein
LRLSFACRQRPSADTEGPSLARLSLNITIHFPLFYIVALI